MELIEDKSIINLFEDTFPTYTWNDLIKMSEWYSQYGSSTSLFSSDLQSGNYKEGVSGWKLSSSGDFEGNDGTFRGTLVASLGTIGGWNINSTSIYTGTEDHSGYTANAGDLTIYSNGSVASIHGYNFYMDTTGILYAKGAVLDGTTTLAGVSGTQISYVATSGSDSVPTGLTYVTGGITTADDGTVTAYATITWDAISSNTFDHYLIRYKKSSYTYYFYVTSTTNTITIDGLVPNVSYDFGIASVNKYGTQSSFSSDITQTTANSTTPPATVTAGSATGGIQYVIIEWTHNTEPDLASYNIYRSETDDSGTAVVIGNCRTNYFIDGDKTGGTTYYYWIKAVNTSGLESTNFSDGKSAEPRNVTSDDVVTLAGSKVLIDGAVYLSDWRKTGDLTKIDGGSISTSTITTTQLNFTPVQTTDVIASINSSAEGITIDADNLTINAATTFASGYDPTDYTLAEGGSYDSAASGARVRIFPDSSTGIQVIDDASNDVFKCLVGGANVGDVIIGNWAGNQGAYYDKSAGTFTFAGTLQAAAGTLGTITTGLITLDSTGYIRTSGKDNYADTTAGIFFGYDTSAYKLNIGDSTKYLKWDGSNLEISSGGYIELFEAGENISSGNIVCIKPSYIDISPSDDAYVDEANPTTNYETATNLQSGMNAKNKQKYAYMKFSMASVPNSTFILKAVLRVNISQITGAATHFTVQRVTGADWAEDTITWNTKPASTDDVYKQGDQYHISPVDYTWMEYDVTQVVRKWKDGYLNNYGFKFDNDSYTSEVVGVSSKEESDSSIRPHLRIWVAYESDEKIYKADDSDYMLCRNVVGVAQEAITSGNTGKVQTQGKIGNLGGTDDAGTRYYLSNSAGSYTPDLTNTYRAISIGNSTADGTLLWNCGNKEVYIQKPYTDYNSSYGTIRYYAPTDARYAKIVVSYNNGSNVSYHSMFLHRGLSEPNTEIVSLYQSGGTHYYVEATWNTNYLSIYGSAAATIGAKIYFYT